MKTCGDTTFLATALRSAAKIVTASSLYITESIGGLVTLLSLLYADKT